MLFRRGRAEGGSCRKHSANSGNEYQDRGTVKATDGEETLKHSRGYQQRLRQLSVPPGLRHPEKTAGSRSGCEPATVPQQAPGQGVTNTAGYGGELSRAQAASRVQTVEEGWGRSAILRWSVVRVARPANSMYRFQDQHPPVAGNACRQPGCRAV